MPSIHDLPRRVHRGLADEDEGERFYEIEGERYPTIDAAAEALGMKPGTVYNRCRSSRYPTWVQREAKKMAFEPLGKEIIEPAGWAFDGGAKRVAVLDPDVSPPKVIRRIGWVKCLACWCWVLSGDVAKQRKCYECGGYAGSRVPYSQLQPSDSVMERDPPSSR